MTMGQIDLYWCIYEVSIHSKASLLCSKRLKSSQMSDTGETRPVSFYNLEPSSLLGWFWSRHCSNKKSKWPESSEMCSISNLIPSASIRTILDLPLQWSDGARCRTLLQLYLSSWEQDGFLGHNYQIGSVTTSSRRHRLLCFYTL